MIDRKERPESRIKSETMLIDYAGIHEATELSKTIHWPISASLLIEEFYNDSFISFA